MKILLINPRFNSFRGAKDEGYERGFAHLHVEPLGLAYIAAVVEQSERHSVDVLDCVGLAGDIVDEGDCFRIGLSDDEFDDHLSNRSFDCIGITVVQEFIVGKKWIEMQAKIPLALIRNTDVDLKEIIRKL